MAKRSMKRFCLLMKGQVNCQYEMCSVVEIIFKKKNIFLGQTEIKCFNCFT